MSDDPISRAIANARKAPRAAEVVPLRPQPPAAPLPPEPAPAARAPVGPQVFEHSSSGVPTKVAIYPAGSGPQSPGAPQIGAAHVHSAPPPGGIAGQSGTQVRMYPAGTGPQPGSQSSAASMDAAVLPAEVLPAAGTRDALEMLIQRLEAGIPKARELIAHPVHRGTGAERARELVSLWDQLYGHPDRTDTRIDTMCQQLGYLRKILDRASHGSL